VDSVTSRSEPAVRRYHVQCAGFGGVLSEAFALGRKPSASNDGRQFSRPALCSKSGIRRWKGRRGSSDKGRRDRPCRHGGSAKQQGIFPGRAIFKSVIRISTAVTSSRPFHRAIYTLFGLAAEVEPGNGTIPDFLNLVEKFGARSHSARRTPTPIPVLIYHAEAVRVTS